MNANLITLSADPIWTYNCASTDKRDSGYKCK